MKYNQEASKYFMDKVSNLNTKVVIKLGFQLTIMYYNNLIIAKLFKETNVLLA